MPMLNKEQYLDALKKLTGDDTSDETLTLIADMTETYDTLSVPASDNYREQAEEWERKYNENDQNWRKKYRDAFFNKPSDDDEDFVPPSAGRKAHSKIHVKDLFTPKGEK